MEFLFIIKAICASMFNPSYGVKSLKRLSRKYVGFFFKLLISIISTVTAMLLIFVVIMFMGLYRVILGQEVLLNIFQALLLTVMVIPILWWILDLILQMLR